MDHTLKITNTLADPTRYGIYHHILKTKEDVTVQDIAEMFHIHPNVARLHLGKLEDVELILSDVYKTGKGGRPGRVYRTNDKVIELTFPRRDYSLLMEMTLDLVGSLGNEHTFLIKEIGQKHGRKLIEDKINHATKELAQWNFDEKMELFNEISHSIGYFTRVRKDYEGYTLSYEVYNCPFKEQASAHPEQVCTMHTAFLEGAFKTLFQVTEFKQTENMTKNCPSCQYHICIMN